MGPSSYRPLSGFVENEEADAEGDREEPVFHRDGGSVDGFLDRRGVAEDEDDDDGEDHGGEEKQILSVLVEHGRLLEDA